MEVEYPWPLNISARLLCGASGSLAVPPGTRVVKCCSPVWNGNRPVMSAERVGEHTGCTYMRLRFAPVLASSSKLGVGKSPPFIERSAWPMSSKTISTTFGFAAAAAAEACANSAQ